MQRHVEAVPHYGQLWSCNGIEHDSLQLGKRLVQCGQTNEARRYWSSGATRAVVDSHPAAVGAAGANGASKLKRIVLDSGCSSKAAR